MYEVHFSKLYKKQRKKLSQSEKNLLDIVVEKLSNAQTLEPKHKDHKLQGEYEGFRECHIKPDLLLIYQKQDELLILLCVAVGSHSELF